MLYLYVMQSPFTDRRDQKSGGLMNEFKRCMTVFTHSPFKVRLMLLNMLCDMFNNKPHQDDKPSH